MPANKRMRDAIKGSIANKDAADALIALFDQFEAMQAKLDADMAHVNAVITKLDGDAALTDDYSPADDVDVDYATVNAIDITI